MKQVYLIFLLLSLVLVSCSQEKIVITEDNLNCGDLSKYGKWQIYSNNSFFIDSFDFPLIEYRSARLDFNESEYFKIDKNYFADRTIFYIAYYNHSYVCVETVDELISLHGDIENSNQALDIVYMTQDEDFVSRDLIINETIKFDKEKISSKGKSFEVSLLIYEPQTKGCGYDYYYYSYLVYADGKIVFNNKEFIIGEFALCGLE